jgi:phosphoenolpyruvate carboxykinase (GTP)
MKIGIDGRLRAINPETGFYGVAPGTSYWSNPMAMETLRANALFTNCALTDEGDVWWEGMDETPPPHAIDWKGRDWTPDSREPAAHPNARFTVPISQCPVLCSDCAKPDGVPIDILIFGGRRSRVVPLVIEAFNWDHGVFLGTTATSETTAANIAEVGKLRFDPFAMLPFCGYNMADYFQHWFDMGDRLAGGAPRIFYANWFRKSAAGKWLWPGFGENSRVLKWMCDRVDNKIGAKETPIGLLPDESDLDLTGVDIPQVNIKQLLTVDTEAWKGEIPDIEEFFAEFGGRLPGRLKRQFHKLKMRLR